MKRHRAQMFTFALLPFGFCVEVTPPVASIGAIWQLALF